MLTIYILLAIGAFIYSSLITLNLDFTWQGNSLVASVPRDLEVASLFLDFESPQTGPVGVKVLSEGTQIYEATMAFEESDNFKNLLIFRKAPKISKGKLELQFQKPLEVTELRVEYRYSSLRYYWNAIRSLDTKGLALLFGWLAVFGFGLLLWKTGLKVWPLLAVLAGHLFFIWMVFEPLTGHDDTYHLPGAAVMTTSLTKEQIRRETVQLIKDSKYMAIRRVPPDVAKNLNEQTDFCPHILSFNNLKIDDCPFANDFTLSVYSRVLKLFNMQSVSAVETGLKVINQLVFFLSILALAQMTSLLFGINWSKGFTVTLAGSLSFYPLLPQTMTTGNDLMFFLISSVGLWLTVKVWKTNSLLQKSFCLFLACLLVAPFILNAKENNKTHLISLVPLLTLLSLLASSAKYFFSSKTKSPRKRELIWPVLAFALCTPILFSLTGSVSHFYNNILLPFIIGKSEAETLGVISVSKVIELSINELIGSIVSGKIYPPSPVKAFYLFVLLALGGIGLKRFLRHDRFIAITLWLLTVGALASIFSLGLISHSDVWISLRFAYAFAPAFWLLYAAGFMETRDFDTVPALVALISVNTIYLPTFVFPFLT